MSENQRNYRDALGCFATGVTIVTCQPPTGQAVGITVNSFASVSLEPPLVSWCLATASRVFKVFSDADNYAVNVLRSDQEVFSEQFATPGNHTLNGVKTGILKTGAPIFDDCLSAFDCRVEQRIPAGDHVILLGRVIEFRNAAQQSPLIYYRSTYHSGI